MNQGHSVQGGVRYTLHHDGPDRWPASKLSPNHEKLQMHRKHEFLTSLYRLENRQKNRQAEKTIDTRQSERKDHGQTDR